MRVLVSVHNLRSNAALVAVAEIVHDIDLKDQQYQRAETAGLARMIEGLCSQTQVDELRRLSSRAERKFVAK